MNIFIYFPLLMEGVKGIDFDAFTQKSYDKFNEDYTLNEIKKSDRIKVHAGKFCISVVIK